MNRFVLVLFLLVGCEESSVGCLGQPADPIPRHDVADIAPPTTKPADDVAAADAADAAEPPAEATKPKYNNQGFGPRCDPFASIPKDKRVWRMTEISYPKGPGHISTPKKFADVVNAEVVQRTMAVYACTNHLNDPQDPGADFRDLLDYGHDLRMVGLSYFARTMAFVHLGLDALATEKSAKEYNTKTDGVRELVRQYLKFPANLRTVYHQYKPLLVAGVKKSLAPEAIKAYLDQAVIPYFTQPVPENVLAAERDLLAAEAAAKTCGDLPTNKGGKECNERLEAARETLMSLTPDYEVLQWMHRRQVEGGTILVEAWGEILTDFSKSL